MESVEVARVDFLEAHVPDHSAVFHYLVLLQLQVAKYSLSDSRERVPIQQVSSMRGKVGVLDLVARFRVRNLIIVIFKAILTFKSKVIMVPIQVRNMSGYVTVYTDLSPSSTTGVNFSQHCTTGKSSSGTQLYHGAN